MRASPTSRSSSSRRRTPRRRASRSPSSISVEFDGTAREAALDLALADPRCAPDVLEAAARRAVESWAQAVDGDDAALLLVATPAAAAALLYPGGEAGGRARVVVRGPVLLRLAITALHADREPPRMEVEANLRGRRYVEDRDTAAVLSGSKDREIEFSEHWTFSLEGTPVGALAARRRRRRRVAARHAQVRVSFLYVMRCGRSASSPSSSRRCSS